MPQHPHEPARRSCACALLKMPAGSPAALLVDCSQPAFRRPPAALSAPAAPSLTAHWRMCGPAAWRCTLCWRAATPSRCGGRLVVWVLGCFASAQAGCRPPGGPGPQCAAVQVGKPLLCPPKPLPTQDALDPDNPHLIIRVRCARCGCCATCCPLPCACSHLPSLRLCTCHSVCAGEGFPAAFFTLPTLAPTPRMPRLAAPCLQQIVHGSFDFPPDVPLSPECKDLIQRILVRDPAQRITLQQVGCATCRAAGRWRCCRGFWCTAFVRRERCLLSWLPDHGCSMPKGCSRGCS